jgi:hypothetical protein
LPKDEKNLREWDDETKIQKFLLTGAKRRNLVTHESTFNTNDNAGYSWIRMAKTKIKRQRLMISEFLYAAQGRLHYIDTHHDKNLNEQPKKIYARDY